MKRLITAAAISVTLFTAGCSSDSTPASQAESSTEIPSTETPSTETSYDGGLVTNAGFKDGSDGWEGNAVNVMDDGSGSNNINFASVATAGNAYDVNLSQILEIVPGKTYELSFRAKSDVNRTLLAGIGLNSGSYANNSETVSLTSEWQTYTLTLIADGFGDDNSRVLFDMGGDVGEVWLDDVSLKEGTPTTTELSQIELPVTFDESDVDYSLTDFGGAVSTLVADPVDATNMVIMTIKAGDAKTWAGTTVGNDVADVAGDGGLATAIPFTATATTMSVRIYSPDAGIPVRLKVERSDDNTVTAETDTLTTVANEWETLVFDLSNVGAGTEAFDAAAGYDKASIFFNYDVAGETAGEQTYYWDDVAFGSGEVTTEPTEPVVSSSAFDFETATTTSTWSVFENDDNPALEIIANPVSGEGNTSATVAKFTARQAGQPWAGTETVHGAIGPFILSADESIVKILVYKTVISDVGIKLITTSGGALGELKVPNTLVNQWEELTFDFSAYIGQAVYASEQVDQIVVFPDYNLDGRSADTINYFDNISFDVSVEGETPVVDSGAAPTDSAATPPARAADDVISVYGEAYAATAGLNFNPDWGQSGVNDLNDSYNPGDGDLSLGYVNFNYQGTELAAINASAMEYLHVDIWVPEGTDRLVKVSPINNGTGAGEVLVTVPVIPGAWNSVDLPKSAFTGMTWDSVLQMKFDGQFNGDGSANTESFDVYLDNIYFYKTGGDTTPVDEDDTTTPDDGDTNLVTDGDFATAGDWSSDNGSINIIDDNGNSVNSVTIPDGTATPDAPWNRNFQQVIPITQGESYTVMFKAKSDRNRSIFVGIGLNQDPWTNVKESVALTSDWQDFEVTLSATDFGGDLNRVFFELAGEDGLVVIDDISIVGASATVTPPETPTGSVVLPVTFEDAELAYTWTDFSGGEATIIDNPQTTSNSSTKVTQLVKGEGDPWAGSTLALDTAVDFTQGELFTMNFWSASLKPVLLKLETATSGEAFVEATVNHTGSGEWELLEFDFSNLTSALGEIVNMTVIVENGAVGDGSAGWTFYVDDITQSVSENVAEPSSALATIQAGMNDAAAAAWSFGEAEALNKVSVSTSTTAYEGSESLRFMHNGDQDWGGFYTTFSPVLNQSSKTNLVFALSNVPATASYLGVKLESDGVGTDAQLNILSYTPATMGIWDVYSIPFSDFTMFNGNFNPANIKAIGFWNPTSSGESAPPYVAVDILIDGINFE